MALIIDELAVELKGEKEKIDKRREEINEIKMKRLHRANKFAKAIALSVLGLAFYSITSEFNSVNNRTIVPDVAKKVFNACETSKELKARFIPYIAKHPETIDAIPNNYESLKKLESIIYSEDKNKTNASTAKTLEVAVRVDQGSRVDLENNKFYFSENYLISPRILPEFGMLYDRKNSTLYSFDDENQRLKNPIKSVHDVATLDGHNYMIQGTGFFIQNQKGFAKVVDVKSKNAIQKIENSDFTLVFNNGSHMIFGNSTNYDLAEHSKLQNLASRTNIINFVPDERTKVTYLDGNIYMNNDREFRIASKVDKSKYNILYNAEGLNVFDYQITRKGKPSNPENKNHNIAFFQSDVEKHLFSSDKTNYYIRVFDEKIGNYFDIPANLNPNYRFSSDNSLGNFIWLQPKKLKSELLKIALRGN